MCWKNIVLHIGSDDKLSNISNYAFPHNHGSVETGYICQGNDPIGDTPIFNWTMIMGWRVNTPPKFNIAPEKWWLEDYFPIGKVTFQGLC